MLAYRPPKSRIYRVGRTHDHGAPIDAWALPDWRYAPFQGRFADPAPDPQYRVRYAAFSPYGAYVEALQRYRPDLTVLRRLAAVAGTSAALPLVGIPSEFFVSNA